ncbi:MAG: shikimate kinase [Thermodesulfobacteriota bacterium]|nr:shikimate kinase [Thermodesulfobacteriota bacterium]
MPATKDVLRNDLAVRQAEAGMNIYIIGYRCTGKSSVGKLLAAKLNMKFTDTDVELVNRSQRSISEIVETSGWEEFRRIEKNIIREFSALEKQIVATGGGAVLDGDNVKYMKETGIVIWLRATPLTIKGRMEKDPGTKNFRPALTGKGTIGEIDDILQARNHIYEEAMDFYIDTDNLGISDLCRDIIKLIETAEEKP